MVVFFVICYMFYFVEFLTGNTVRLWGSPDQQETVMVGGSVLRVPLWPAPRWLLRGDSVLSETSVLMAAQQKHPVPRECIATMLVSLGSSSKSTDAICYFCIDDCDVAFKYLKNIFTFFQSCLPLLGTAQLVTSVRQDPPIQPQ